MTDTELKREVRSTARLVLLDESRRILLFLHNDGRGGEFWATPGGGIEPGETEEQAARREAAEELGARHVTLARLWTGHSDFLFANRSVSQTETFFRVTQCSGLLECDVDDVHRLEGITKVKWWLAEEIESSSERIFPADLAKRMREFRGE